MDAPEVHQNVEGFSTGKVLLMLLGVVIIGITGWYLWHTKKVVEDTLSSTSNATGSKTFVKAQ